jgi:RNA polymerase sigma-70 factor, ECF subfamily
MQHYSDEELITLYKTAGGNQRQKAFDCLYLRYVDGLKSYFFYTLGRDTEKAKDFVHDLFVKLLETPELFDAGRKFKPWIYRVATNMCNNEFRNRKVAARYEYHFRHSAGDTTYLNEQEIKLQDCIKKLNPEERSLIVLRFRINLRIKEIASIYNCAEGTVKSRLFYATKELTKLYKDQ